MIIQGSQVVNTQYMQNLTESINAAGSCAEIQALVTEAFASISAIKAGIALELESLAPILALLSVPSANPAAIVTWITSFITGFLTPAYKPTITYAAELAALAAQVSSLISAISLASGKFPSCSIGIPAV